MKVSPENVRELTQIFQNRGLDSVSCAVEKTLSLLEAARINSLIVLPASSSSNDFIQLMQMKSAVVSKPFLIPKDDTSVIASLRVPAGVLNPAFLGLAVYKVSWP